MDIFYGINEQDRNALLGCLQAVKKTYLKGEVIFDVGDDLTSVGYILEGEVQLSKDDYDGNKVIVSNVGPNETFGEAFVCAGVDKSEVSATALVETQILLLNFHRILSVCVNTCPFHKKLIENIIKTIATKNIMLQKRIELLSKKTLRERILHFLRTEKKKTKKEIFEIPYSREQMALYISADRSALSRELSNMKNENIIDYDKNTFRLK